MFTELTKALKRAEHFTKDFAFGGEFSPIGRQGLSIPIRNALWLLDLKESTTQEDYEVELHLFHWMALKVNQWIDSHLVEGDEEAVVALAAFRSRVWFESDSCGKLAELQNKIREQASHPVI